MGPLCSNIILNKNLHLLKIALQLYETTLQTFTIENRFKQLKQQSSSFS